jgi:ribosomal protein S18 acetylase RimI-like enzyme
MRLLPGQFQPDDLVKRGGGWDPGQEHVQFLGRLLAACVRQQASSASLTAILAQPGGTSVPTDLKAVIQTLCVAFDTGLVTESNFPRHMSNRSSLVGGYFCVTTEMILGHGGQLAAAPGHEAAGVWSPAGAPQITQAELAGYASQLAGACGDGAEHALRSIGAHRPDLPPHFHVMFVAVRPGYRKQGAAVEMVRTPGQALTGTGTGVRGEASSGHGFALWQRMGGQPDRTEDPAAGRAHALPDVGRPGRVARR